MQFVQLSLFFFTLLYLVLFLISHFSFLKSFTLCGHNPPYIHIQSKWRIWGGLSLYYSCTLCSSPCFSLLICFIYFIKNIPLFLSKIFQIHKFSKRSPKPNKMQLTLIGMVLTTAFAAVTGRRTTLRTDQELEHQGQQELEHQGQHTYAGVSMHLLLFNFHIY